jgi:hypothetical protein
MCNKFSVFWGLFSPIYRQRRGSNMYNLITQLHDRTEDFHFWAVNIPAPHAANFPSVLERAHLTKPLRYTPTLIRQCAFKGLDMFGDDDYKMDINPMTSAIGDGPDVIELHHHGEGHTIECKRCGQNVATELRHIEVGPKGKGINRHQACFVSNRHVVCTN